MKRHTIMQINEIRILYVIQPDGHTNFYVYFYTEKRNRDKTSWNKKMDNIGNLVKSMMVKGFKKEEIFYHFGIIQSIDVFFRKGE